MLIETFMGGRLLPFARTAPEAARSGDVLGLMAVALGVGMLLLVLLAAILAMVCKVLVVSALRRPAPRPSLGRFLGVAFLESMIMSLSLVTALASLESRMPGGTQSPPALLASVLALSAFLHGALAFAPNLWLTGVGTKKERTRRVFFGHLFSAVLLGLITPALGSVMIMFAFDLASGGLLFGAR